MAPSTQILDKHEEAPPPRRDWLGHGLQTLATIIFITLAALAWGDRIEGQIADQRVSLSALSARVDAIEAERKTENEARRAADAALAAKLDTMTSTLATITAQSDDLRRALKR
ncbi:MAG TPA: hypothetical protein VE993_10155 [Stellaceae bacterium]|nr:hypothetical protein [Stellaceae bacterium]